MKTILDNDQGDLVAVGRDFLSTPDLAERWRKGLLPNDVDPDTLYGGGAKGYTDYPTLDQAS